MIKVAKLALPVKLSNHRRQLYAQFLQSKFVAVIKHLVELAKLVQLNKMHNYANKFNCKNSTI